MDRTAPLVSTSRASRSRRSFGLFASRGLDGVSWFLWNLALPALVATWVFEHAVPTPPEAFRTRAEALATFADDHPTAVWTALFGVLSVVASYWWRVLFPSAPRAAHRTASPVAVLAVILLAAASAVAARRAVGAYEVLSGSMLPTLEPGDVIVGNRLAYGAASARAPRRGDIVVFHRADAGEGVTTMVKRVIGLPGDRISMDQETPIINGWPVPSCDAGFFVYPLKDGGAAVARLKVEFLDDLVYLVLRGPATPYWPKTYVVKPGEVFVLGDNRGNSSDSRAWKQGEGDGLPVAAIDARALRGLYGLTRGGRIDPSPLFRRLDPGLRLDGMDTTELRDGIARCLLERPSRTSPPAP